MNILNPHQQLSSHQLDRSLVENPMLGRHVLWREVIIVPLSPHRADHTTLASPITTECISQLNLLSVNRLVLTLQPDVFIGSDICFVVKCMFVGWSVVCGRMNDHRVVTRVHCCCVLCYVEHVWGQPASCLCAL